MPWKPAVAIVAILALLTSCGPRPGLSPEQTAAQIRQETGGREGAVTAWPLLISHENGAFENRTLFMAIRPDGGKVLFDWTGRRYEADLDDFRANNHVLAETDKITLDNTFPDKRPLEAGTYVELMTVTGHTGTIWTWWFSTGMAVLLAAALGLALRLRSRRRTLAATDDTDDTERFTAQQHREPTA
ncbi:hypothetical protein CFN78_21305 [Amycolatopsis antarctica]|uniref:Uncharacterized protein n=1 Tax=Amycolatopsis antarctica TaxID=1854586 RepID=A0A263D1D1_9PSEU|nr:hypothetical protein [Amycolatopsis antarctica]OZM71326.1 hypothetical protein CFN78_21305 [Amycolatopsis antarctica]